MRFIRDKEPIKDFYKYNPKKRQHYKDKVEGFKATLEETKTSEFSAVRSLDKGEIVKQMNQAQKTLERGTPDHPQGIEKDRKCLRAKELREFILKEMPTRDEMMGVRKRNSEGGYYQEAEPRAIDKQIAWMKGTAEAVREYKTIMRELEPDDPDACNIDKLREHASSY